MEEINELISRYGLEQDSEHVIIPFKGKNGKSKRCFILKRRYIRIMYSESHFIDYPLIDVIEAVVRNPELPLSEALHSFYSEREAETTDEGSETKK